MILTKIHLQYLEEVQRWSAYGILEHLEARKEQFVYGEVYCYTDFELPEEAVDTLLASFPKEMISSLLVLSYDPNEIGFDERLNEEVFKVACVRKINYERTEPVLLREITEEIRKNDSSVGEKYGHILGELSAVPDEDVLQIFEYDKTSRIRR